jgi:hypothetical protein
MAFTHGKAAVFLIDDTVGGQHDISAYLNSTGLSRSADLAETSTLGSVYKSFVSGLIDGKVPIAGLFDPTVDGYLAALLIAGTSTDFEYYPQGNASGLVKEAGHVILTSYELSAGLSGASTFTGSFQVDGEIIRTIVGA